MNRATSPTGWARNPDGTQGYTWNPITGCLNGCEYCYARKLANTRLRERYLANKNLAPFSSELWNGRASQMIIQDCYNNPFYPRFWGDRMRAPTKLIKPSGIFVCDMSDLFGIGIPLDWQKVIFKVIECCPQHRFYLLTKQPQNLIKFSPFPDNCWVGVSITDSKHLELSKMFQVGAKMKYISFEPLLQWEIRMGDLSKAFLQAGIKWVIIGSQTKPYKPPKIEWVKEIVEACDNAGIPVFLKDNLRDLLVPAALMDNVFWEGDKAKLRQEMPNA